MLDAPARDGDTVLNFPRPRPHFHSLRDTAAASPWNGLEPCGPATARTLSREGSQLSSSRAVDSVDGILCRWHFVDKNQNNEYNARHEDMEDLPRNGRFDGIGLSRSEEEYFLAGA